MWRNGRRNGLKIRSGEIRVWVRIPSSAPSKTQFYDRKSLGFANLPIANCRAQKRTKIPFSRQLFVNKLFQERPKILLKELFEAQAALLFVELRRFGANSLLDRRR